MVRSVSNDDSRENEFVAKASLYTQESSVTWRSLNQSEGRVFIQNEAFELQFTNPSELGVYESVRTIGRTNSCESIRARSNFSEKLIAWYSFTPNLE